MSWFHDFLSKFHHTEDQVSEVVKNLIHHVEEEFTTLENSIDARFTKVADMLWALAHPPIVMHSLDVEPPALPTESPAAEPAPATPAAAVDAAASGNPELTGA